MEIKLYHDQIEDASFRHAVDLIDAGSSVELENYLAKNRALIKQHVQLAEDGYFSNPCLLEFVAENPVRHGSPPDNIVEIAKILLDFGSKDDVSQLNGTLELVASGRVIRESGFQKELINLLCHYGANPDTAMLPALAHGEFEAVEWLIHNNAAIDLPVAAGTGRLAETEKLLSGLGNKNIQLALSFAAQHGHTEILKLLLTHGADPNLYNPKGAHAFSTPLHQAVISDHFEGVKLLVDAGARLDLKDTVYDGTPLDWAIHAQNGKIEKYLRSKMK